MRGLEVSAGTLALDLIDRVGPGGEFMLLDETAKRCRAEIWNPTLMDRLPWDVWEAAGGKTATDRIRAKLKKILARHTPPPLPPGADEKIAAILREAEARRVKKQALPTRVVLRTTPADLRMGRRRCLPDCDLWSILILQLSMCLATRQECDLAGCMHLNVRNSDVA